MKYLKLKATYDNNLENYEGKLLVTDSREKFDSLKGDEIKHYRNDFCTVKLFSTYISCFTSDIKDFDLKNVEKSIALSCRKNLDLLTHEGTILTLREDILDEISSQQYKIADLKRTLDNEFLHLKQLEIRKEYFKENLLNMFEKYHFENGKFYFSFEDVVAEDVDCQIEDIHLGTVNVEVDIFKGLDPILIESDTPQLTPYNEEAHHPHDLGEELCLGSLSSDMREAIMSYDMDKVKILMHKFVHTFSSSDAAGATAKAWLGEDLGYVQIDGEVLLRENTVEFNDELYNIDNCFYSDYYERFIPERYARYSINLDDYILEEESVQLEGEDNSYMPKDHEELYLLNGLYYLQDEVIQDIEGVDRYINDCVYSETLESYIFEEDAVLHDGEFYTEKTLPKEDEE